MRERHIVHADALRYSDAPPVARIAGTNSWYRCRVPHTVICQTLAPTRFDGMGHMAPITHHAVIDAAIVEHVCAS